MTDQELQEVAELVDAYAEVLVTWILTTILEESVSRAV